MPYRHTRYLLAPLLAVALTACEHTAEETTSSPADESWAIMLPVSLNEVMVAMVNHAADPIWEADWRPPETEEGWRALERYAYQLEIAGTLLTVPGTGPADRYWVSSPEWIHYSQQLSETGAKARVALGDRDAEAIRAVGNELVAVCEGCHTAMKPAEPTGGKYGELSPTPSD